MNTKRSLLVLFILAALAATTPARGAAAESCYPSATRLCLNGSRFQAEVSWTVPGLGAGAGQAVPLAEDTGSFWFFSNSNVELLVKVLDGRLVNGHFWVYYGGLSDVEYTLTVTDMATGVKEIYANPAHQLVSRADTAAFDPESIPVDPGVVFPIPAPAVPLRQGPELQFNVTTRGFQIDPSVASLAGGGFVVAWTSPPPAYAPLDFTNVYGRLYDKDGQPRTGEFPLSATLPGEQGSARVAAGPAGDFLAVWLDQGRLTGRLFGADGQPRTGEIRIGFNPQSQGTPAVVSSPAGGYLVAWPERGDGTLRVQRFSAQGSLVGNEIALTRPGDQVRAAAFPPGGPAAFVLSWVEGSGAGNPVRAIRLDAQGRPIGGAAYTVNTDVPPNAGFHRGPTPVVHPDGGFSIVWTTSADTSARAPGLFARRYGADGLPAGNVMLLLPDASAGQSPPTAVTLSSGNTLVAWYQAGQSQDLDGGLFAGLYDPSWAPVGGALRLNTFTQATQTGPVAAADGAGGFVAAWESGIEELPFEPPQGWAEQGQDGSYFGVFGQRFTTATCALGAGELCLGGRFRVAVQFIDPQSGGPGQAGAGHPLPLTSDTGGFWFFDSSNVELILKVIDGRTVNGHFWMFYGALSDVEYTVTVTDTATGRTRTYHNDPHHLASRADTVAF